VEKRDGRLKEVKEIKVLKVCVVAAVIVILFNHSANAAEISTVKNPTDTAMVNYSTIYIPDPYEVEMMSKTAWGEGRGLSTVEIAGIYWNIQNRVDSPRWDNTVEGVLTHPGQYAGWSKHNPTEQRLLDLAYDVTNRWVAEKLGEEDVGRVLPADYLSFSGDGKHNYFRNAKGQTWDWSLPNPYEVND
jgi:hypothetical protein